MPVAAEMPKLLASGAAEKVRGQHIIDHFALYSHLCAAQGLHAQARQALCKAVHIHPELSDSWGNLAAFSIGHAQTQLGQRARSSVAVTCARVGGQQHRARQAGADGRGTRCTGLHALGLASSAGAPEDTLAALRGAQAAVHADPASSGSWAVLACAGLAHGVASSQAAVLRLARSAALRAGDLAGASVACDASNPPLKAIR